MNGTPGRTLFLHTRGGLRHSLAILKGCTWLISRGLLAVRDFLASRYATVLILLLALALRLWRLGDANLWWDEALAVWAVRKGLIGATLWTASDVHPPLYFWSLWAWVQLYGQSEFAMRSLSAFAGLVTVALVYCVGALVGGRRTGNLAALLTALARFHVWWSQEMRMYVLAAMLGTASTYFLLRWWRREHDPLDSRFSPMLWLSAYIAFSAASLYTILLMGALVIAQNAAVLISWLLDPPKRHWPILFRWILSQLVLAALHAVWLFFSWGRMRTWSVAGAPMDPSLYLRLYGTLLVTGISENIDRYTPVLLVPLTIMVFAAGLALAQFRRQRHGAGLDKVAVLTLVGTVAVGAAAIYAATLPRSLFYTPHIEARYFLPFAPAFWILLAWSVTTIARRWRAVGAFAGVALVALWLVTLPGYYTGRVLRDTLQTMSRTIISQTQEGDLVLLDSGNRYPIFLYYYDGISPGSWRPPVVQIPQGEGQFTSEKVEPTLEPLLRSHSRIWLAQVDVNLADPDQLARRWLDEHVHQVLAQRFGADVLYLYDPQERPPALRADYVAQYPINATVRDNGHLEGWELPVSTYAAGDIVHISLLWDRMPDQDIHVELRTTDGRSLATRRAEAEPGAARRRQQFDMPVYSATPGGTYHIVLTSAPGQELTLGSLIISGTQAQPRVGRMAVAVGAQLGEDIALEGYTLHGAKSGAARRATPGETLTLDLYWRAAHKPQHDYTVFAHLLGQAHNARTGGPVWAQHDSQPIEGGYPTSQWLQGQLIVDRHRFVVDEVAPPGEYRIEVGLYSVEDGQRLAVTAQDGRAMGNHVLLETTVLVVGR